MSLLLTIPIVLLVGFWIGFVVGRDEGRKEKRI
jgi:hypothetical protein